MLEELGDLGLCLLGAAKLGEGCGNVLAGQIGGLSQSGTESSASTRGSLADNFRSLKALVLTSWEICARYQEAAALYQQLSCLSDAELQRRGLSRATLARDVCEAHTTHGER